MKRIVIYVVASPDHPKFGNLGIKIEAEGHESKGWLLGSARKLELAECLINKLKARLETIENTGDIKNYDLVKGTISDLEVVLYQKEK